METGMSAPTERSLRGRRKTAGLAQIFLRLLERDALGVFAGRALGARKSRAGVDVVYRAVVLVTEAVRDDVDGPGVDRLVALCVIFGFHYGFSTGARTRLPHSVQEPS